MTRFQRCPPSSLNRRKLLRLFIYLLIKIVTILSQTPDSTKSVATPDDFTTVEHVTDASAAAETPSAKSTLKFAYRQTMYTQFANVYATQLPLATVHEATREKCCHLCLHIPSCSGFNYLRSPSSFSGSCDPKDDPKSSTCEFLAFESISRVYFAEGAMTLCQNLYANGISTNERRSGLNPCLSSPCQNFGACVAATNSYFCNCNKSTTGTNCETVRTYRRRQDILWNDI